MSRKLLVPLFAAALLVVPAIKSAQALTNLNSSRSNMARIKHVTGTKQHGTTRATTVKSSKSNTSDRAINLNSSKSNRKGHGASMPAIQNMR
jgi:hypothetical protein